MRQREDECLHYEACARLAGLLNASIETDAELCPCSIHCPHYIPAAVYMRAVNSENGKHLAHSMKELRTKFERLYRLSAIENAPYNAEFIRRGKEYGMFDWQKFTPPSIKDLPAVPGAVKGEDNQ